MVISHELWVHAKGPFTPAELRMKQAVWEWYSALSPQELERVRQSFWLRRHPRTRSGVLARGQPTMACTMDTFAGVYDHGRAFHTLHSAIGAVSATAKGFQGYVKRPHAHRAAYTCQCGVRCGTSLNPGGDKLELPVPHCACRDVVVILQACFLTWRTPTR